MIFSPIKNVRLIILASILIMQVQAVMSQGKPADPRTAGLIRAGVKAAAQETQTISSDFVQEKEMNILNEKIITRGKFYFKKERNLRWEYTDPYSYLILFKDDRIIVRDENKTSQYNVQSNKVFAEVNRIILGCIRGTLLSDQKNFTASYFDARDGWIVRLQPQQSKLREMLKEIVLWFDRENFSVNRLEMIEQGGDRTMIVFTGKKLNQPVADGLFTIR